MVAWGSWLIDQGYRGELECIIAKIFGSEAEKEAAVELFMKTHGGRSFLHGHLFGDGVHEFLAPCIYEGEGEMLGMAFFKSLVKEHGRQYFEPIGKALQQHGIKNFSPANPVRICGSCASRTGRRTPNGRSNKRFRSRASPSRFRDLNLEAGRTTSPSPRTYAAAIRASYPAP